MVKQYPNGTKITIPVKSAHILRIPISGWDMLGQFKFYKMGSNKRPIYVNSKKQYLYLDRHGIWSVSYLIIITFVKQLDLFTKVFALFRKLVIIAYII